MTLRSRHLTGWCLVSLLTAAGLAASDRDLRLLEATKKGDKAAVRALLKQGVEVNAPQGDGATALHWAAHRNDLELVDLLIRAGAKVNIANDLGATPLWVASSDSGGSAIMERLLRAGADPNLALGSGETPLMTASRTGNADGVKQLLAHGANVNAKERSRGQTALMWAAAQGHPQVIQALIENGADLSARADVKVQLVNIGGSVNSATAAPEESYHPFGVVELPQRGYTPLLFAATQGNVDSARFLLAGGAKVNDPAPVGATALVIAAFSGHGAFATFLLDNGADPNAAAAGYTALHAAIVRKDEGLVRALLAHGANPNAPVVNGTPNRRNNGDYALGLQTIGATPLVLAAQLAQPGIMRVLAQNGADPRFVMKDGTTALMAAFGGRQSREDAAAGSDEGSGGSGQMILEAVKAAVDAGIDVNAANQAGNTALHIAVSMRLNGVVEFLIANGAKADATNKNGDTPLSMAEKARLTATIDLLRKSGR